MPADFSPAAFATTFRALSSLMTAACRRASSMMPAVSMARFNVSCVSKKPFWLIK
jgi:hypothetical protein